MQSGTSSEDASHAVGSGGETDTPPMSMGHAAVPDERSEPIEPNLDADYALIKIEFDTLFYRLTNRDVAKAGIDPVRHYLDYGFSEGRDPSPRFSTDRYLDAYPDVANAGLNPFVHYLRYGRSEHRITHRSDRPDVVSLYHLLEVESCVDQISEQGVIGWAWVPEIPALRLTLELWIDQGFHGLFHAEISRPDLAAMGKGDGCHGFHIPLSGLVRRGGGNAIRIVPRGFAHPLMEQKLPLDREYLTALGYQDRSALPSRRIQGLSLTGPLTAADMTLRPPLIPPARDLQGPAATAFQETGLYTFDIWDTVLRRDCAPDEIKLQSARFLRLIASPIFRPAFRDVRSLLRARLAAENASAPDGDHEYRFEDGVLQWLNNTLVPGVDADKFLNIYQRVVEHETRAEKFATRADPTILQFLESINTPSIFISDFYLSSNRIHEILDKNGLGKFFERGYSSSDIFETKRDGQLIRRVAREMSAPLNTITHVGDNELADVIVPSGMGLRVCHYVNPAELARREWFDEAYRAWLHGDASLHHSRVAALLDDLADEATDPTDAKMHKLGVRFALVPFTFILNVLESSVGRNVEKISFFTREGQLFEGIYRKIIEADVFGLGDYPASQLLEVSRRATFAASLSELTPEALMRMWRMYSRQSPRALARSLNLSDETVSDISKKFDLAYEEVVTYPWLDDRFRRFLASDELQSYALQSLTEQRDLLSGYLSEKGLLEPSLHTIVDIGWRGTIQDNIALLNPAGHYNGHYLGLFGYLNPQPNNSDKLGFAFDDNQNRHLPMSDIGPIEMLCNGTGGSVTGYRKTDNGFEAIREIFAGEEVIVTNEVAAFQRGIMRAIAPLSDYVHRHGITAETLRSLAGNILQQTIAAPPPELADAFFRLHHNETFGTGELDAGRTTARELPPLGSATSSQVHASGREIIAESRWPEGAAHRSSLSQWWTAASDNERLSLPRAIATAHAPAIVRARGTRCHFFVPPPIKGSGGHRTIYKIASGLERIGANLEIFLADEGAGLHVTEDYLEGTRAILHRRWDQSVTSDISIATVAASAEFVRGTRASMKGYLVQDFEALFNPMSDGYLSGENSYALGLNHFTIGSWLSHKIRHEFGGTAYPAGLGADLDIYRPLPGALKERAICFLYQPDKMRRAPMLGIHALRIVKQLMPDVTIYVYGSDLDLHLDFSIKNIGMIYDLKHLNELYNRCMGGLCISGSNPSRIPYEMMAAGCIPVDLYRYNNLMDHSAESIFLAYQDPESIAKALMMTLSEQSETGPTSKKAIAWAGTRSLDWEIDLTVNRIASILNGEIQTDAPITMSYDAAPIIADSSRHVSVERFCTNERHLAMR